MQIGNVQEFHFEILKYLCILLNSSIPLISLHYPHILKITVVQNGFVHEIPQRSIWRKETYHFLIGILIPLDLKTWIILHLEGNVDKK